VIALFFMKKGQAFVITVFAVVVVAALTAFFLYYSGASVTGEVSGGREVTLIEKTSSAENLLVPSELKISAEIGKDNKETFEVVNLNEGIVEVSCFFPDFQEFVPSSGCFTYDLEGNFVGDGKFVRILPGKGQTFTASVFPFANMRIKKGGSEILVDIRKGEYSGRIELNVMSGDENKKVSVISIPVRIFVEE